MYKQVQGFSVQNKYNLKPILNVHIPINTSFTSLIKLHNPHNSTLQVVEMYTSDDDLHIELPDSNRLDDNLINIRGEQLSSDSNEFKAANISNNLFFSNIPIKQWVSHTSFIFNFNPACWTYCFLYKELEAFRESAHRCTALYWTTS